MWELKAAETTKLIGCEKLSKICEEVERRVKTKKWRVKINNKI